MQRFLKLLIAAALASSFAATTAFAHAFLDRAIPAVGSTVSGSPSELRLAFTQGLVAAFAGVEIRTAEGAAIAAGKPSLDPADATVLRVRLGQPLKPGAYKVSWHVVSVDTHRTEGSYTFTVAP
ncbi:MAG: copper homeostasis periplasmic binding protein CopC [Methylocella sp.]